MSLRSVIIDQFEQTAREQGKKLTALPDDLVLLDMGLDSLFFAVIVTRLEDALGLNPFVDTTKGVVLPVTVGDFIKIYEGAEA